MIARRLRGVVRAVMLVPARGLVALGVGPDVVTVVGTLGVVVSAFVFWPAGRLELGAWLLFAFAMFDSLDGTVARLSGRSTRWGAFLDSTLDRVADASIFGALAIWFHLQGDTTGLVLAVLVVGFGALVPYARAKAESMGVDASNGIAERGDRLALGIFATWSVQALGVPVAVLHGVLALLLLASVVTTAQRAVRVLQAFGTEPDPRVVPGPAPGAAPPRR
ncbi:phosphatidylinositol phosphate synthase [Aquipuribacter nitratireducens]|uniref:Phosphatidylinositol phosphate synthase n=1 Tax=Aquipuribacter nitratireducens TaxID=650104 RepID=A0ABW0GSG5_9MICO